MTNRLCSLRLRGEEHKFCSCLYSVLYLLRGSLNTAGFGGRGQADKSAAASSKLSCIAASSTNEKPCFVTMLTSQPCCISVATCWGKFHALTRGSVPSLSGRLRSAPIRAKWVRVGSVPRFQGSHAARNTGLNPSSSWNEVQCDEAKTLYHPWLLTRVWPNDEVLWQNEQTKCITETTRGEITLPLGSLNFFFWGRAQRRNGAQYEHPLGALPCTRDHICKPYNGGIYLTHIILGHTPPPPRKTVHESHSEVDVGVGGEESARYPVVTVQHTDVQRWPSPRVLDVHIGSSCNRTTRSCWTNLGTWIQFKF